MSLWNAWIFSKCTVAQCKILVCGLWVLWMDRNKNIHEGRSYIGKDAASFVRQHLGEIDGINESKLRDAQ